LREEPPTGVLRPHMRAIGQFGARTPGARAKGDRCLPGDGNQL